MPGETPILGLLAAGPATGTEATWAGGGLFVWGGLPEPGGPDGAARPDAAWYQERADLPPR